jgi:hypothetical protein
VDLVAGLAFRAPCGALFAADLERYSEAVLVEHGTKFLNLCNAAWIRIGYWWSSASKSACCVLLFDWCNGTSQKGLQALLGQTLQRGSR